MGRVQNNVDWVNDVQLILCKSYFERIKEVLYETPLSSTHVRGCFQD